MHRHGYVGRKFGREVGQRRALIKGLATDLVLHGKIETTLPKAKELVRYIEKLITKAKKGDLASRRAVIAKLNTQAAAVRLVDVIAPQLTGRTSGHVRVERTSLRVGDGTQMATIAFVDTINDVPKPEKAEIAKKAKVAAPKTSKPAAKKPAAKKPAAKKETK